MDFFRQAGVLTATALHSLPSRFGSVLVTIVGVTTVVAVLVSMLALEGGVAGMAGTARADEADVLSRGAPNPPSSVLTREAVKTVMNAPGIKRTADGTPYAVASTLVSVDAIRKDGRRGTVYLVGETPGAPLVDQGSKIIDGRRYRPGVPELVVPDTVRKLYRGFEIGDDVTLRGKQWKVVGVFTTPRAVGASVLHADADTVMSAFNVNTFQEVRVILTSPAMFGTFKEALVTDPAIQVDVKTAAQVMNDVFGALLTMLDFVAYFIGGVMAFGAICGALNSLYASVDARRRELATLRAVGFRRGPIISSVLAEGLVLAVPGAVIGSAVAWVLFNGHKTPLAGFVLDLAVTPHLVMVGVFWALVIGLIGASLPAIRVIRVPIAKGVQAA